MSEILVDNLIGKTSAGNITVTSEGGAATQSLQQGLCKQWSNYSGAGITFRDSFNTTSATDNGTGRYTINLTSAMSTNDNAYTYSNSGGSSESVAFSTGGDRKFAVIRVPATSSYGIQAIDDGGAANDCGLNCSQVLGDLA